MMVHFRKRISSDLISRINDEIFLKEEEEADDKKTNKGELILDATCAPQDIRFPQDASLLNEAREKLEAIIDLIYAFITQMVKSGSSGFADIEKPRTYRKTAHKVFLKFTKGKGYKVRKLVKQLLQFVERDLRHIEKMCGQLKINNYDLEGIISSKQIKDLDTIILLAAQQREMIDEKKNKVKDRIVSISQPYVRPIVRNKTRNKVEFGAKIQMVVINGYVCLDKLSWDNYNEGSYLIDSINKYKDKYGYYPEVVLADNIYKIKNNKEFCAEKGIRFLGNKTNKEPIIKDKELKKAYVKDLKSRQKVEGKFGNAKRRNSLGLIMTKLQETSETSISLEILMLNINKSLAQKLKM